MATNQKIISLITAASLLLVAAGAILIMKLGSFATIATGSNQEKQRSEVRAAYDPNAAPVPAETIETEESTEEVLQE